MTTGDFIANIEAMWSKTIPQESLLSYERVLDGLEEWRLQDLLDRVLKDNSWFPKPKDIWQAANDLGYFKREQQQIRTTPEHTWTETKCNLCHGEGRLHVWFERYNSDGKWCNQLKKIFQLSSGEDKEYQYQSKTSEAVYLYRCSCPAGDAVTLPESWPKWKDSSVPF